MQNLETVEEINYGASGKVLKVFKKDFYALKVMNIRNVSVENMKLFLNEHQIMQLLDHPNTLKTYGIYIGDKKRPPSILLEYCPKNLDQVIKDGSYSNVQIICAIYQIAEGMKYVHFNNIIHRDLKPTNILIAEDGTILIGDFGISKLMTPEEQSLTFGVGTQKYMAPEILKEEKYDEKVDVYSFGVLMYFMLNKGEIPHITLPQIISGHKADIPSSFTKFARQLINSCWNFDPKDRPSFESICQQMEKNKYNLINVSEMENKEILNFVKKHNEKIPKYSKKK